MIGIVNYGAGNLQSIGFALEKMSLTYKLVNSPADISQCTTLLIPGVGAFSTAMYRLETSGLSKEIINFANSGRRVTGICLGMQLLFESSEEGGRTQGLGLLSGRVVSSKSLRPAHPIRIGWEKVQFRENHRPEADFYFAHSYEAIGVAESEILGYSKRGSATVVAAVNSENVIGLQFHPEKSGQSGLECLKWALGL